MSTLIPSASACHTVQMPPIEKDDRLNLNVRTGSASTLHHSFVFTYGGLTIGLELDDKILIQDIASTFVSKVGPNKLLRFAKYVSGEIFYLDLISKVWSRVAIPVGAPKPKPRLFHELATGNNCLYLFGGLTLSNETSDDDLFELVPCNDLWEFNLLKKSWVLLHDGSGWERNPSVPSPRFSHKMTTICHLSFAAKKDHSGLMIAGGHDRNSLPIYSNCVFDVVDKVYVEAGPPLSFPPVVVNGKPVSYFKTTNLEKNININYLNSVIINFKEEFECARKEHGHTHNHNRAKTGLFNEESLFIYAPTSPSTIDEVLSPLLTSKLGKSIKQPKLSLLHRKRNLRSRSVTDNLLRRTVPHNLRYPTGGVFGQNIVIIGFLPHDYDISIFIYNKPTGKWSRLNIFCNHDYGSHRFWGGFAWTSHHKVVLLGNYVTSHTTSSVRYFSSLITVSLPVTNMLASMEMAGHNRTPSANIKSDTETSSFSDLDTGTSGDDVSSSSMLQTSEPDDETPPIRRFSNNSARSESQSQKSTSQNSATFNDYVHYAAPKVKFTKVRSVFPPAAITLGRNAFDRYGNIISDFEFISTHGDRIPVCLSVLTARWGKFFIDLLAKAYVKAVNQFEHNQIQMDSHYISRSSKCSASSSGSHGRKFRFSSNESLISLPSEGKDHVIPFMGTPKPSQKEAPQFRLPFQEKNSSEMNFTREVGSVDPHNQSPERRNSLTSNLSGSSVFNTHLKEIPAQLPLPHEPIPDVPSTPVSYRSSSRKNSTDVMSPRASLLHTLNVLRNIPKSPKSSPRPSPRGSVSGYNMSMDYNGSQEAPRRKFDPKDADKLGISSIETPSSLSVSPRAMSTDSSKSTPANDSSDDSLRNQWAGGSPSGFEEVDEHCESLLDFPESNWDTYNMEPSLIPRKLYVPFSTNSLKAFAEYLYTGQVGNKWLFRPCALDCLWMSRYYKVQLLYDLLCEVLYGIIGRKELTVIKEGKRYRKQFNDLFEKTGSPMKSTFKFPLDEYEGFLDTVDDGYMDIALLRKSSNVHKTSNSSRSGKCGSSFSLAKVQELASKPTKGDNKQEEDDSAKNGKTEGTDITDDSTSASDEDAPPLHFLDYEKKNSLPNIRYKSIFDKSVSDAMNTSNCFTEQETEEERDNLVGITLENLVSMDAPEPSDCVIDLIYEVASVCADVKLMLRSMNARRMSLALAQTKKDYFALEKRIQEEMDEREISLDEKQGEDSNLKLQTDQFPRDHNFVEKKPEFPSKISSASSVTTLKSLLSSSKQKDEIPTDNSAETESRKFGISGSSSKLATVKELPIGSVGLNKKLDKQIAQLIRQDEKLKLKAAKEEKNRRLTFERGEKKRSDTLTLIPTLSPATSFKDRESASNANPGTKAEMLPPKSNPANLGNEPQSVPGKARHRLLGRFGRKSKHNKQDDGKISPTPPQLSRTDSLTSINSSASKKSSSSKISGSSVGGFLGLRKK